MQVEKGKSKEKELGNDEKKEMKGKSKERERGEGVR